FSLLAPSTAPVDLTPYAKASAKGTKATNVPLPETGTYRVVLLSANGASGPYAVRTKGKPAPGLKKFTAAGSVPAPGAGVEFPFVAQAGGSLKGKVLAGGSGLDPSVQILAPGGSPIPLGGFLVSKPLVSVALTGVPLPATGTYTLRVTGANGTIGAFSGKLSVLFPRVPPLVVNEP
ncbi:MAG TPA: hypothetical protein VKF62_00915, partial [Planctomycetota bacterium]|nr:hypothetical protein [Planctomycetota bacterium]